jgi:hypothetical protein
LLLTRTRRVVSFTERPNDPNPTNPTPHTHREDVARAELLPRDDVRRITNERGLRVEHAVAAGPAQRRRRPVGDVLAERRRAHPSRARRAALVARDDLLRDERERAARGARVAFLHADLDARAVDPHRRHLLAARPGGEDAAELARVEGRRREARRARVVETVEEWLAVDKAVAQVVRGRQEVLRVDRGGGGGRAPAEVPVLPRDRAARHGGDEAGAAGVGRRHRPLELEVRGLDRLLADHDVDLDARGVLLVLAREDLRRGRWRVEGGGWWVVGEGR